jgi:hypothetical protein
VLAAVPTYLLGSRRRREVGLDVLENPS